MARLLENWLDSFLDWTLPRSESPESFLLWSGLFTMASAVKRHVYFPKSILGSYEIQPYLYVIFVGPAGVPRKSTSAGLGESLLYQVPEINFGADVASASTLFQQLSESKDGSLTIISSEFSDLIGTSNESMYEVLTSLFDGRRSLKRLTRAHGIELTENPCLNLLAATTPKWLSTQPPEHLIGGGFSSRVIYIYENRVRRRRMYYHDVDWNLINEMEKLLVEDLKHISTIEGEFKHDKVSTRDAMETWYREYADEPADDERVEGYFNRKHVHMHKIAMLLSLAERDDCIITMEHFRKAVVILEAAEQNMAKVLQGVGKNQYSNEIDAISDFIHQHPGPVEERKILQRFYHRVSAGNPTEVIKELLSALVVMGEITPISPNGTRKISYKVARSSLKGKSRAE